MSFTNAPMIGRKSFHNFNKPIEDLARIQELEQRQKHSTAAETREMVSDAEMAQRLGKKRKKQQSAQAKKKKTPAGAGVGGSEPES
ncbi:hypothetical protein HDU83_007682 [Entophlyctis luteolus]|nr:hypothetical protein HDU83_007682 [Entophlyctis luteolus]